jgi:predicted transcriptional regulator
MDGGWADPSAMVQALANAAVAAGWSFDDLYEALCDPSNRGGESVQRRITAKGEDHARDWLHRSWSKADEWVSCDPERTQEFLRALDRMHVHTESFVGRTASTDLVAYRAILRKAAIAWRRDVNISVRELALEIGVVKGTAASALKRLCEVGLLEKGSLKGKPGHAATYHLNEPPTLPTHVQGSREIVIDPPNSHPQISDEGGSINDPGHDVWRNGLGLGKSRYRTYQAVVAGHRTMESLDAALPVRPITLTRHLKTLQEAGLVQKTKNGFEAISISDADADALAKQLGSAGRGSRQQEEIRRERELFQRLHRAGSTPPPELKGWALFDWYRGRDTVST